MENKEIIKIVIKGTSGFFESDDPWEEKITLKPDSISCEHKYLRDLMITYNDDTDHTRPPQKWTYKTTSSRFKELFQEITLRLPRLMEELKDTQALDTGEIIITMTYADKTRETADFWLPPSDFDSCFSLIAEMIPRCEEIPALLPDPDEEYSAEYDDGPFIKL